MSSSSFVMLSVGFLLDRNFSVSAVLMCGEGWSEREGTVACGAPFVVTPLINRDLVTVNDT